jgi:hypothetical protein
LPPPQNTNVFLFFFFSAPWGGGGGGGGGEEGTPELKDFLDTLFSPKPYLTVPANNAAEISALE